jgi:hypothetical protein
LDDLLNRHFPGKVVRKDLTKLVKEGANVPVYVLEYLLGSYCASNDEVVIAEGLRTVKKILAENYVRPDEAEKVKSTIRERGSLKVIDKVTVSRAVICMACSRDALLSKSGNSFLAASIACIRALGQDLVDVHRIELGVFQGHQVCMPRMVFERDIPDAAE